MFTITEDWFYQICLLDYDTGIAGKYWHNLPRKKRQSRWSFEKDVQALWLSEDMTEALYETSSQFVCDKLEDLKGREFLSGEDAHNYVFGAFHCWWFDQKTRRLFFKNKKVAVSEKTIGDSDIKTDGVEMKVEWKDLLSKVKSFAEEGSTDDAFFFEYLLMTDEEKNSYWSQDKQQVRIGNKNNAGRWVKRQTFYNHLNKFKKKLSKAFN